MRARTVLLVILLLLAPGLSGAGAASLKAGPGSPAGPDPYWSYDGNGGTNALRYDIAVSYDFAARTLRGRAVVTMQAKQDLTSFTLDLLLPVQAVKVDGRVARFGKPSGHELRVVPAATIDSGDVFRVAVAYAGRPGAYRYAGERNWLADGDEVVTMNEPHMAPWWFPSNDHPSDKARFDIRVTAPRGKRVVSNGTLVSRTVRGTRATTHWRMQDPMATYLAFFAAGRYDVAAGRTARGIPYYYAVSRQLPLGDRTRAMRQLRFSGPATDWLQAWLGTYPFTSTGGLVTGLDVGFALENQTRPTYGAWVYPGVIVHELAHQWFGDSVAVRRWRDIWLNEGFATFAEKAFDAAHGGRSVAGWLNSAYQERCHQPSSSFWTLDLTDPGPARVFDEAVYDRGAMVLGALQNRIGATALRGLLRAWVAAHHDGNAGVAQFEALAAARTGQDLGGFFDAWLRDGTVPPAGAETGIVHACS
ncbi:MAG TPA: M1 family metallopeptidase [Nocardioides sp.]|nr:M1 family metallopeptidase [Nocardioides sp.]